MWVTYCMFVTYRNNFTPFLKRSGERITFQWCEKNENQTLWRTSVNNRSNVSSVLLFMFYIHLCVHGHDDDTLICYYHKFKNGKVTAAHISYYFFRLGWFFFLSADNPLIRLVLINDKVKLGWNHYELANHEHIYIFVSNYIHYPFIYFLI